MCKNFFIWVTLIYSLTCFTQENHTIIDNIIKTELKEFPSVGLVVGIYNDSKTRYYCYGNQFKNGTVKMDSTTIFEIGSATKTFTALLLAQAIQNGKMKQYEFIDKYIPNIKQLKCELRSKILLSDLATHQSGLPNLSNDKYFSELSLKDNSNPFRFVDEKYLLNILEETDSLTKYREYQYNNYAFSLLCYILEKNSNVKFENLIAEQILQPLQMNSTSFKMLNTKSYAGLYNQQGVDQKPMILNKVNPAGGLKSNAVDLIKYLKAFLIDDGTIIPNKIIERTYFDDANIKMGLGWEIGIDFLQKDGDTFGNSTLIRYSKKHQIGIVILSNHQNGKLVNDLMTSIYNNVVQ